MPHTNPSQKDLNAFLMACNALLSNDDLPKDLTPEDRQRIHFYLAALTAKFPALTE